jgi:hypothetical protein
MTIPYNDARMLRFKGRKAALDGEPRISPYRVDRFDGWAKYDAEWCRGFDEAAKAPDEPWFDADGEPYRCGARTKVGKACMAWVDRRGHRCHIHRERPPAHAGPQLPLPRSDVPWQRWTDGHRRVIEAKRKAA